MFVRFVSFDESINTHLYRRVRYLFLSSANARMVRRSSPRNSAAALCVTSRATHAASRLAVAPPAPSRATSLLAARAVASAKTPQSYPLVCRGAPLRPEANVTAGDFFFSSISASASVLASRAAAASLRHPALSKCANAFSSRKYARRLQCDPPPATEKSSLSLTYAERKRVPGPGSRVGRRSERGFGR